MPVFTGMTANSQGIVRYNFYPPLRNINRRYPPPSTLRANTRTGTRGVFENAAGDIHAHA
jgi:hypothetical protein